MDTPEPNPETAREKMNEQYHCIISRLIMNAERDLRLAQADGNAPDTARARARLDTLNATLGIYAASHRIAYGTVPWKKA